MLFSYLLTTCVCFLATAYAKSQSFPFPQALKQPNSQCKWKSKILIPICSDKVILSICISLWQQPSKNPTLKPTPQPTNKVRLLLHLCFCCWQLLGVPFSLIYSIFLFAADSYPNSFTVKGAFGATFSQSNTSSKLMTDLWIIALWCWISWIYSSYLHI